MALMAAVSILLPNPLLHQTSNQPADNGHKHCETLLLPLFPLLPLSLPMLSIWSCH